MEVNKNGGKIFIKENENQKKKLLNLSYKEFKIMTSIKKSRDIPIKEYSLSGKIVSKKNESIIEFESSLERDYIYLLEFDENVYKYCEQPVQISNDDLFYTPDFYVEYLNEKKDIIEIKYSSDLLINLEKYQEKFDLAREYCSKNNLNFKILTEVDIRTQYLENIKFLLRFKSSFNVGNNIDSDHVHDINLLIQRLTELKESTIFELLNKCSKTDSKKAELTHILWHLVSLSIIKTDLNTKLTMNNKIWI